MGVIQYDPRLSLYVPEAQVLLAQCALGAASALIFWIVTFYEPKAPTAA
jgi:hypothetical protein